jgi:hypothetical protein
VTFQVSGLAFLKASRSWSVSAFYGIPYNSVLLLAATIVLIRKPIAGNKLCRVRTGSAPLHRHTNIFLTPSSPSISALLVVGGEASSAGHGQEAGKLGRVYMPWPQSGRTQYEETTKQSISAFWKELGPPSLYILSQPSATEQLRFAP